MKIKSLALFLLVATSLGAQSYNVSPEEMIGLSYVFGANGARKIASSAIIVTEVFDDRPSQYLTATGKVEVNKKYLRPVRNRLILVHEGAHLYQHQALNRKMTGGLGANMDSYKVWIDDLSGKLGIEPEGEICRQLAAWYLEGMKLIDFPECIVRSRNELLGFAWDSVANRNKLWMYCEKYMALQRPLDWANGAPDW